MGAAEDVVRLFAERGDGYHGEVVDQRRHALQCATLAREHGADDHLVAAALLHDVGHLVTAAVGEPRADLSVDDDHHEAVGARWVTPRFGPDVARAIALHVMAKRYWCTVDPAYVDTLSVTSVRTLHAQGGLIDADAVTRFAAHPGCADALALRAWDEAAKDPDAGTEGMETFLGVLERLAVTRV